MNIGLCIYFLISIFFFIKYIPRNGIAGWYGSSTFSSNCFPKWLHQFTFPPTAGKGFFCLYVHQHLVFLDFLMMGMLLGVRCLILFLICLSLMISGVEFLFICLLATYISSWKNIYSGLLSIFNWVLVSLFLSCKNSWYVLITSSLSDTCFANILFHRAEVSVLINSNLLIFFLYQMDFLIMLRC